MKIVAVQKIGKIKRIFFAFGSKASHNSFRKSLNKTCIVNT